MQFIKKVLAAQWDGASLVDLLGKNLSGWRPTRNFRTLHASQLTDDQVPFCPREAAILDLVKKPPRERYVSVAMQVAFDQGKSLHEHVRSHWLKNVVIGDWHCDWCGLMLPFQLYPDYSCPQCTHFRWAYKEPVFVSQLTGVSGSMDTFISFNLPKVLLTEIKTVDKDQFKTLKAPLAEHRLRTILYLHLIRDSNRPERHQIDQNRAKVLYISKGFGIKGEDGKITPFKEFDITYNQESIQGYLDKAMALQDFRTKKAGMPKGICPTSFVNRVKSCACPQECWSSAYPIGAMVDEQGSVYGTGDTALPEVSTVG